MASTVLEYVTVARVESESVTATRLSVPASMTLSSAVTGYPTSGESTSDGSDVLVGPDTSIVTVIPAEISDARVSDMVLGGVLLAIEFISGGVDSSDKVNV